ncbi:MAG TPA: phosphatidate cytidylyltransferase [Candidatus Obscuribacterales bacterium]
MGFAANWLALAGYGAKTAAVIGAFFLISGLFIFRRPILGLGPANASLASRYVTFALLAPLILIPAYFGGILFSCLVALLVLQSLSELCQVTGVSQSRTLLVTGATLSVMTVVTAACCHPPLALGIRMGLENHQSVLPCFYLIPFLAVLIVLVLPLFQKSATHTFHRASVTVFGVILVAWLFSHLILMRNLPGGFGFVVFLIMSVVFNDIGAFTVGKLFGKTQLAPLVSPNKTWEGAAGGALGTVIAALLFSFGVPQLNIPCLIGACVLIALFAPLGDLSLSAVKRDCKVKDFGTILPGTGGVLDRLDSLILAAPVFYYFLLASS